MKIKFIRKSTLNKRAAWAMSRAVAHNLIGGVVLGLITFSASKLMLSPNNPVTNWFKELVPAAYPINWPQNQAANN